MKTFAPKFLLCWLLLLTNDGHVQAQTVSVTFDDVSTTWDGYGLTAEIPQAYHGLWWGGFRILNSMDPPSYYTGTGYRNGVVSPRQVAWSLPGEQQGVFSPEPMTLQTGYMTAAYASELRVQVQGYRGFQLAYDETYTINMTTPTLVTFNFMDITRLTFIPEGTFVIDNFTYVVPEPELTPLLVCFVVVLMLRTSRLARLRG